MIGAPADPAVLQRLRDAGVQPGGRWLPSAPQGTVERALERWEAAIAEFAGEGGVTAEPRHARRFAASRVARLATATPDGAPHLVPIVFAVRGDTIYHGVDAKPKRTTQLRRLANIAANPRVSVLVDHYDDDWTRCGGCAPTAPPAMSTRPAPRDTRRCGCYRTGIRGTACGVA